MLIKFEKEKEDQKVTSPRPKRKFGFSSITVDAKSLMKDGKKGASTGENRKAALEVTSPRKVTDSDSDAGEKKSKRTEKATKKMAKLSQRKTPRQRKAEKELPDPHEAPPTQMQALEQGERVDKLRLDKDFSSDEDETFRENKKKKPEAKRRPVTKAEPSAPQSKDVESDKSPTSIHDSVKAATDGQSSVTKAADSLNESAAKFGTTGKKTEITGPPSQLVMVSSKPGSAKSQHSSGKAPSLGGAIPDAESHVSSATVPGQSLASSVVGERSVEARSEVGTKSGVTAESFEPDGRKSVLSTEGSEDSKTAFRLSLLSKEPCAEETVPENEETAIVASVEYVRSHPSKQEEKVESSAEPYVRECRRDSLEGKSETSKKSHLKPKGKVNAKPSTVARSAHGLRGSQPKSPLSSGGKTKNTRPKNDSNPDDLLAAYFERQKAKEISKNTPHVLSTNEAEEMLKAVGRKKPPSPILEDEDAEEMEENGIGGSSGSRPSLDFTSGKMFGSRHSATPSIPEFSVGRAMSPASTIRATTPSISIIENESVWSASSPAASIGRGLNSPLPRLNEIPLSSSPLPNYTPRIVNRQGQRNMDVSLNSNISDMVDTRVQKEDVAEGESRKMSPLKEKDNISALSVSSISMVAETVTTSSQRRDDHVSKSTSSNQAEGLNATKAESSDSNGVFERDIDDKPLDL
ncbi:hypothetical protein EGW08_014582 [Elysia chlorotica]|uniref:Uncharacterized protein n=1 Tax=Elysia chlorotica TaxID=188477 RepID=A0A3S0ZLI0_ELYCH|nr:hypothetical protein EGW08_014582 [Elysia chlorotica]